MRIIVPVKPLAQAKSRLGTVLSPGERARVMCGLLARVVKAANAVARVSVVTADGAVAAMAMALGADVIDEGAVRGLDGAARLGVDQARRDGEMTVMVLAADLPEVTVGALKAMLSRVRPRAVVIAPSRDGGTNAIVLASHIDFRFAYGPDSFTRHCAEARRLAREVIVHESEALGLDIDRPEDLAGHQDLWAA
jgi:2-phospho-L-lactate guanylyltransferase